MLVDQQVKHEARSTLEAREALRNAILLKVCVLCTEECYTPQGMRAVY